MSCDSGAEKFRASMGPRPIGRGVGKIAGRSDNDLLRLQWGRGRSAAEFRNFLLVCVAHDHASMGPRPIGRGVVVSVNAPASVRVVLQWGRGRSAAELALL